MPNQFTHPITHKEIEFIKENYSKYTVKELTELLNKKFNETRNYDTIKSFCRIKLGLHRTNFCNDSYSKEEDDFIIANCNTMSRNEMSYAMYKKFGIERSPASLKIRANRYLGVNFKENQSDKLSRARRKTDIGHLFKNHDGYTFIKISNQNLGANGGNKRYIPYQNYLYQKYKGDIPKGYVVKFLDGDNSNFDLDNLYCVINHSCYLPLQILSIMYFQI